jgi:hypothetical protein
MRDEILLGNGGSGGISWHLEDARCSSKCSNKTQQYSRHFRLGVNGDCEKRKWREATKLTIYCGIVQLVVPSNFISKLSIFFLFYWRYSSSIHYGNFDPFKRLCNLDETKWFSGSKLSQNNRKCVAVVKKGKCVASGMWWLVFFHLPFGHTSTFSSVKCLGEISIPY